MKRALFVCLSAGLVSFALSGAACRDRDEVPAGPPGTSSSPRRVEVKVSNQGFTPARVAARAGESLRLSFRYDKSAGECGREVVLPSQQVRVTLSEQAPTEIAVQLPANKTELAFTCGMNMLRGAIVVQ